jgi:hypothetical protein
MNINRRVAVSLIGAKDKPLQANYEEICRDMSSPERRVVSHRKGKMYRDSEGRERWDEVAEAQDGSQMLDETILLYDPIRASCFFSGTEFPCGDVPPVRTVGFPSAIVQGRHDWRDLPEQTVEGFLCKGYRAQLSEGVTVEYWYSEELDNCLMWREKNGSEEKTFRLFKLLVAEPDSSYFRHPRPPSKSDR